MEKTMVHNDQSGAARTPGDLQRVRDAIRRDAEPDPGDADVARRYLRRAIWSWPKLTVPAALVLFMAWVLGRWLAGDSDISNATVAAACLFFAVDGWVLWIQLRLRRWCKRHPGYR